MEPPVILIVLLFATATTVPPQFEPSFGLLATVRPAGNVSLNAIPVNVGELKLLMVKPSIESPPERGMLVGVNAIEIEGGAII